MSWPATAVAGARERAMPERDGAATETTGCGPRANCGATCAQVGGRSRVIHAFFAGL